MLEKVFGTQSPPKSIKGLASGRLLILPAITSATEILESGSKH